MEDFVESRVTETSQDTRRGILRSMGLAGAVGVAGATGLSVSSQPTLAINETVKLPTGLVDGTVNIPSYEIQYADLDPSSDITIDYILTVDGTLEDSSEYQHHTVSITERNGSVMTGDHSITVPAGEVSLQIRLSHPSIGTVESVSASDNPTTISSSIPSTLVDTFEDNDMSEWGTGYDTGVGGLGTTTTGFNGSSYAGRVYTNSSGSLMTTYNTTETLDASVDSITIAAYIRWNSTGTTMTFGVVDSTNTNKSISFGSGYKQGYDWMLYETKDTTTRNYITTSNSNGLNSGTWYEVEFEIKSDQSVTATIYNLDGDTRTSERIQLTGTATYDFDLSALYIGSTIFANNSGTNYDMFIDNVRM